ncbi:MAG: rhomboid family intramembrane serine protease, partial [bacterium]|nr:rhomboid family intramembrane serine protease [bacterium]
MRKFATLVPEQWKALPLLSVGFAVVCLLTGLTIELGFGSQLRAARDAHYAAARLTAREPLIEVRDEQLDVVRAVNPRFENDTMLEFMRATSSQNSVRVLQEAFDQAAATAKDQLETHPFRTLGVVPDDPQPAQFAAHALLHAGPLHLLASVLMLLLAGPVLERLWGRWALAGTAILIAAASAGVYALAHASSTRPLIGCGALIAGLVAAVLTRRAQDEIDFVGWLGSQARFDFTAPGWVLGGIWLLYEASLWVLAQGALPRGADNAVGYSAHAAGMLLGAGMALLFDKLGLEKEERAPRKVRATHFDLKKVLALRDGGEADTAYHMLQGEVERSARNRDIVMTYWEMALEREDCDEAAPVLVRLIEEELRRGAEAIAAGHWKTLHQSAPRVLLEAPKLIRIARAINSEHGEDAVAVALAQALDENNTGLTPAHAANVARMAFELDPQLAARAAKKALRADKLEDKVRSEMEMLATALSPEQRDASPAQEQGQPAPSVFFEESDRSAFGQVGDLSAIASESFPDGAISEAKPTGASGRHLTVDFEGRGTSEIDWTRMRAVAIVGVHGLCEKPIVLIDILLDGAGTPQPLTVLRLRCDRFDPRVLVPKAATSKEALRTVASGFRKQGIRVLADLTA